MSDEEQCIRKWFNDHQAYHSRYLCEKESWPSPIEHLIWSAQESDPYDVKYWDTHGILTVKGGLGVAVYEWDTLHWKMSRWANLDLEEFASKCIASEHGPGYRVWDTRKAEKDYRDLRERALKIAEAYAREHGPVDLQTRREADCELKSGITKFGDIVRPLKIPGFGMKIHINCHAHLVGLQMAFEQLKNLTKESPTQ
jgi:hypothetical protein